MPRFGSFRDKKKMPLRKRAKPKIRTKKKDPIFINGERPRPKPRTKKRAPISINGERPRLLFVDYKDWELLNKLTNRQGKIVSRRKSGCTAASQHAVTLAIKRARFMALLPYVGE